MKDIERSDLISTRYLSEIDDALVSTLNLCPSLAISAFIVLRLSGALVVTRSNVQGFTVEFSINWMKIGTATALVIHGLIFRFVCDDIQQMILLQFIHSFVCELEAEPLIFDFLSNPQRSQHHAMDHRTHNSITERCFSYIVSRRLTHFPGVHHWASKSKRRPWLWRWRKPKGAITNSLSEFRWRQEGHIEYSKKREWSLVLALEYLPYLLNKATRSRELIALAKMWSYLYPLLVSFCPRETKKAGKAVEHYLSRFDGKEQSEREVVVGPLPLCIV